MTGLGLRLVSGAACVVFSAGVAGCGGTKAIEEGAHSAPELSAAAKAAVKRSAKALVVVGKSPGEVQAAAGAGAVKAAACDSLADYVKDGSGMDEAAFEAHLTKRLADAKATPAQNVVNSIVEAFTSLATAITTSESGHDAAVRARTQLGCALVLG